jgi:hypothetical protein
MTNRSKLIAAALSAAALTSVSFAAHAAPTPGVARSCFRSSDWSDWRSPSPDVIYLKVRLHDVYRVNLAGGSNRLNDPGIFLISQVRGSEMICSPLDLDLKVSDSSGFSTPLIARSITKLTPEEVAAIPAKFRPR